MTDIAFGAEPPRQEFPSPAEPVAPRPAGAPVEDGASPAFLSRCIVLQAIGGAGIAGLWTAGIAGKPFAGDNAFLCWLIVGMGVLGIVCVFRRRWNDVQWLATHVVRIGLLGTVIGLIIAFAAAGDGGSASPDEIKPMVAAVVQGMYVSLYATLLGIATNLWLKINLRLLGRIDG
jgi:MotA/TolQ/ExbB proton channel family